MILMFGRSRAGLYYAHSMQSVQCNVESNECTSNHTITWRAGMSQ